MSALEQWLQEQSKQGRRLYLVLDSDGQLDERNALVSEFGFGQYRNLYLGTPTDSLAIVVPYLIQLALIEHPTLQVLLNTPERHWG